jgi:hypothetical protein
VSDNPSRGPTALDERRFLLQRAQPALSGLIDGSLSSLAPIFAVALAHTSFLASLASVTLGGVIIVGISVALGSAAG